MAQVPLTLKTTREIHEALKTFQPSVSKKVGEIFWKSDVNAVFDALKHRYSLDEVTQATDVVTKVLVSEQAFRNLELMSFKLGLPRDTVVRLLLENFYISLESQPQHD